MPRRKTDPEAAKDVELHDDEILVAPADDEAREQEPESELPADEGVAPLVEGAPVSAAARANARNADA